MTWAYITGTILIISFIISLIPELRIIVIGFLFKVSKFDTPKIVFEDLEVDNMRSDIGRLGIDPGYYIERKDMAAQKFIKFDNYHQIRFTLKSRNILIREPITIKKIYINVKDFQDKHFEPFLIAYDYGAGETEKIYAVNKELLANKLKDQKQFRIEAVPDKDNIEKFDLIKLDSSDPQDYFKVKIPMKLRGVIRFSIEIITRYRNKEYSFSTEDLWIGNSKANEEKWYLKGCM